MVAADVICVFAKYPEPGKVKNRLGECLGKKEAAFLARAFLMDTIATSLRVPRVKVMLAYFPPESKKDFEDLLHLFRREERDRRLARKASRIVLVPQLGSDLGERLKNVSEELFGSKARKLIFVGSDSPLLTPVVLRASLRLLEKKQVVLGPTFDGGYYLLGVRKHYPFLFNGISWSTEEVYRQTVERISEQQLDWQELEISYDVDRPQELGQLYADIDNLRLAGENQICYHTERCLENLTK